MTMRALTSGVTGMLNNQISLDVIANNLANVNTPGYKASRVSFANSLVQTTFTGSAPGANVGGRNPQQIGLGVNTASIDIDMGQGALQATGRELDLAIQGEGFFELTDGTRRFYSRVGNFGLDADNTLIHQSTGYRIIGNSYSPEVNPDGTQNLSEIGVPIEIDTGAAFPPQRTSSVQFQGNLSSESAALRGTSVKSLYQLTSAVSGSIATENTPLSDLTIFKGSTGTPDDVLTVHVFGTRPDGAPYSGEIELNPYREPTAGDPRGSVGDLIRQVNDILVQGNTRFGSMRIENGTLIATGIGSGEGFSLFMGENDPTPAAINQPDLANAAITYDGTSTIGTPANNLSTTIPDNGLSGLYKPTFTMPAYDFVSAGGATGNEEILVAMQINGNTAAEIRIPAADYATGGVGREFSIESLPHVAPGDTVTFAFTGSFDLDSFGQTMALSTAVVDDANSQNLTNDLDRDGNPDMFQEGTSTDVNAWQYRNETNEIFNWYQVRMTPDLVSSSIEIYDAQGGRHTVEARFFRTGTRTEANDDARLNSWDMILNVPYDEGVMTDNLVTGIEFDQEGRFTGNIGTTTHGTTLDAVSYVGSPASQNIQVDWITTGPTDPATVTMDFGEANTFEGLTGFGSTSTAAAVDQDGYGDGQLDSLSISSEGDIVALYTNGISRALAQVSLATFRNPEGLAAAEGNLWSATTNSGNATRRIPGTGSGFITSGALESGNVDIATEFSRLVTAQRGFQVSARLIQTTDDVLEELANLTR